MQIDKIATGKVKYNFIDVLRVVACFLVIVNHTIEPLFRNTTPSVLWYTSLTYFFICKIAVPIFIMISGYTMLDRIDSYTKIWRKISRTLLILGLFSVLYYWEAWVNGNKPNASLLDYFISVFRTQQTNAFWYLYLYLGILIMLPFLQKMVANLSKRDIQIFIGLCLLITGVWPILTHYNSALIYNRYTNFSLFDGYIGLLLIGYYLKKYVKPTKTKLVASYLIFIASTVFSVLMTRYEYEILGGKDYLFYDNRLFISIVSASISFFYIISLMKVDGMFAKVMAILGSCSFGIYLLSDFLIRKFSWIRDVLYGMGLHPIFVMIIFECIVFMVGFIITYILKKIPGLKKLL